MSVCGRALVLSAGLFSVSFLLRIANVGFVFVDGSIRFPSGRDELYHVRRIVYQVLRFPELLDFDPYVSFPFGAISHWPPFLDWSLAALVRLFADPADALGVERVVVWVPPLLGAATVAALGELGRRHFSFLAGLVAGLLVAVMHAHHVHSQLGQVDHQVVLGLATVLLFAAGLAWIGAAPGSDRQWRWAGATGLVIAGALLVSPGALLQILPVQASMLLFVLAARDRGEAVARARTAALAHGVAALGVAPACFTSGPFAGMGPYSPFVLSAFQPLWLGAGAAGLLLVVAVWRRSRAGERCSARVAVAAAIAGAGCALALVLAPELRGALVEASGWFSRDDPFLGAVSELRPLFYPRDRFDPAYAVTSLTPALLAFPYAWLLLAARGGVAPNARPKHTLLLVWTATFLALALAQERFANPFALGLALVIGVAAEELRGIVARRLSRPARLVCGAALAGFLVAWLAPSALDYRGVFASSRGAPGQTRAPVMPAQRRAVLVEEASRFLREATPPTRGFLDASLRPDYGVLASWDVGHLVRYRAERPTVQDNFARFADPRAFELARRYFDAEDEEAAFRVAAELGARYTVATRDGSGQTFAPPPHSVGQRLWRHLGNGAPGARGRGSPALARHRLIWVRNPPGGARDAASASPDRVAVFEIVPAARVTGSAAPGETVHLELELRVGRGRVWYRATTEPSPDGRWEIRLPYPTDRPVSAEVRAAGPYRVRAGGRTAALDVLEADVREGATVSGPDLSEHASASLAAPSTGSE